MALTADGRKFDVQYYIALMASESGTHAFIHKTASATGCSLPYSNSDLDEHVHICNAAPDHRAKGAPQSRWTIQELLSQLGPLANGTEETLLFRRVVAVVSVVLKEWVAMLTPQLQIGKNKGTIMLLAIDVLLALFPKDGP